jgi:T5SS/PEP-CTERM-associated repeat protein
MKGYHGCRREWRTTIKPIVIAIVPAVFSVTSLSGPALAQIVTAGGVTPAPFNVAGNKTVPALVIGTNANGTLDISGGSVLTVTPGGAIFGQMKGVTGTGTITGKGSLLTSADDIEIATQGTGDVTVSDCGGISSGKDIIVGASANGPGELNISGKCSSLKAGRNLVVGSNAGNGTFLLRNGATANVTNNAFFGRRLLGAAGGTGTGNISGTGTQLKVGGDLRVGSGETGSLTIRSGANVTVGGSAFVGTLPLANQPGNGTLNLNGGTLNVTGGGLLVGLGQGSVGSVDAVRSTIKVKETVFIGDTGSTADMTVQVNSTLSAQGFVTDGPGKFLVTGRSTANFTGGGQLKGTSNVTVDGPGSSINAVDNIITPNGTPTLDVLGGGKFITKGNVLLGTAGGVTAKVDGAGSVLGALDVVLGFGAGNTANLTISNNGRVSSPITVNKGSTLTGRKGVDGKITNNGGNVVLAPGGLRDTGAYVQAATGTLTTELASSNSFGVLDAAGKGNFGFGTDLDFVFNFQPVKGETFTFFDALGGLNVAPSLYNCVNGVFNCSFSGVSSLDKFEVLSSLNTLTLVTVSAVSAVPEPNSTALFGAGLALLSGLTAMGRRKTQGRMV